MTLVLTAAPYLGFVISLYLTFVHYRGYISPCYVVQGCEQVQASRYSVALGIPIALFGVVFFALMFYVGIGLLTRPRASWARAYRVLAYAAALAAVPLFLLQALVIRAFCTYCVATELIMVSMWIVSFFLPAPDEGDDAPATHAASG